MQKFKTNSINAFRSRALKKMYPSLTGRESNYKDMFP